MSGASSVAGRRCGRSGVALVPPAAAGRAILLVGAALAFATGDPSAAAADLGSPAAAAPATSAPGSSRTLAARPHSDAARADVARPAPREAGVRWAALTPAQREALAPLERDWPSIDADRKQKWLVMADRFRSLAPADRERIQARMTEWAKLSPAERGQARLRFQEANRMDRSERRQRWLDYQALPPEQKRRLAARAASAPALPDVPSAATLHPVRAAPQSKANLVPNPALSAQPKAIAPTVVRAGPGATTTWISKPPAPPPHQQTGMPKVAATPEFVDRSTLLPRRGPQAAAIGSPIAPHADVAQGR